MRIMVNPAIQKYYTEVERIIRFGGTRKETAVRTAFITLLNEYAKSKDLILVTEVSIKTPKGKTVTPDGTLKDSLRQDWGYYESKDEYDDLDEEIEKKFLKGYPQDNILFEDSHHAVLFQSGVEVMRTRIDEDGILDRMLKLFINFERPEVKEFRQAIELFKQDVPIVTDTIKDIIQTQEKSNKSFISAQDEFLELCRESINPEITKADVQEMMIQHILTADIFNTIFDEPHFHRENNVAKELEKVIDTFFTGNTRRATLGKIQHYYQAINAAGSRIADHHEKQRFLKVIYETFYKSYNPKAADKLGVVYTPNEIVKFMIESTDHLLQKHFGKMLHDKGVEILDPATGTGTFICDIIDYIHPNKLDYKYKNELHANEVSILPYYIANLNIEFTYKQKMQKYQEYENLCFVDTLDNVGFTFKGKQTDMFGLNAENALRIRKQNDRKISVIIGNPPYNANQANENDNNKNRIYPVIDKRIKDTFIKYSNAQKTKLYDPYARFYRWAMDRIGNDGVVCMITNNSFISSKTFDGFRKCIQDEFKYAYIIDLGGDIRGLSGKDGIFLNERHTIFGKSAAVGIAMMFLIKDTKDKNEKCLINYIHPTDIRATRDEKIAFLENNKFKDIPFENIQPDKKNNWILGDEEFETFVPLVEKSVKTGNVDGAIFKLFCWGNSSNRDEWVYDFEQKTLKGKIQFFIKKYNSLIGKENPGADTSIKWSSDLKKKIENRKKIVFDELKIVTAFWRPFFKVYFYADKTLNDRLTDNHFQMFGDDLNKKNKVMMITAHPQIPFIVHSIDRMADAGYGSRATNNLPLYRYDEVGNKIDNITDWGLQQFIDHYQNKKITKESIFNYCYAVLHNPKYCKKYEINLKQGLPRIPFYPDFNKWCEWGGKLMDLHINYEKAKPFKLKEITDKDIHNPKPKLKGDKVSNTITIDEATELHGVPGEAWLYKLGNRSALDWVLDQYKEYNPGDPTISDKFNTYKFGNHKQEVLNLLARVTTVSIETIKIVREMELEKTH